MINFFDIASIGNESYPIDRRVIIISQEMSKSEMYRRLYSYASATYDTVYMDDLTPDPKQYLTPPKNKPWYHQHKKSKY